VNKEAKLSISFMGEEVYSSPHEKVISEIFFLAF